ncbi:MAG: glycosyltransferase family 2 protein [Bryobacteraceae bacterium]|nr:glycosyltransferase family 2 protein [Bryobacteraceae bacterium]
MKPCALVSVIICTVRRPELYSGLIASLTRQTWPSLEVLIVGREGETAPAFDNKAVRWMSAPKGLAPARNVGLANATGDVVIFFDDDVAIPDDFISHAMQVLSQPEHADVGGLTGYDTENYGAPINLRWKLRRQLGITPSLEPGDSNHLGRSVTLAFFHPFTGCRNVKWLPGFCQIFRREAIQCMRYDEKIIVEDRDFSMRVGDNWRLIICGDLRLRHLMDGEARHSHAFQTWRAAFGLGRIYAKRRRNIADRIAALQVATGELLIDSLVLLKQPSFNNAQVTWMRLKGFTQGYISFKAAR